MERLSFIKTLIFMLSGMIVWTLHFLLIYALNTLACMPVFVGVRMFGIETVPLGVGTATLAALALSGVIGGMAVLRLGHSPDASQTTRFLNVTTAYIAALSVVAILWNAIPAFVVPPCG